MKQVNPAYRERLFAMINESPFVRHIAMQITDIGWGTARFVMEAAAFRLQPFSVIHGGNLATLIDSATFWACFLALDNEADGLTSVDLKLNYLAPSAIEPLACEGRMIKRGKTLSYAEAHVTGEDGRLLAHGTSTLMRLPGKGIGLAGPMWTTGS